MKSFGAGIYDDLQLRYKRVLKSCTGVLEAEAARLRAAAMSLSYGCTSLQTNEATHRGQTLQHVTRMETATVLIH